MGDTEILSRMTVPPVAWPQGPGKPVPLTGATIASFRQLRSPASGDRAPGVLVLATGLLEAVAVRDGRFTPVLRCVDLPRAIALEFTEQMQEQALDNLCRWVAVEGRLCSVEADGYRLEVHRLRAVHRIDGGDRDPWR